jgi:hypothetical protein
MQTQFRLIIIAQIFISGIMAFLMSGIFTHLEFGPTVQWLQIWAKGFAMAWPIAFVLSMAVGPAGFRIARFLLRQFERE